MKRLSQKQLKVVKVGVMAMSYMASELLTNLYKVSADLRHDFTEICCSPNSRLTKVMEYQGIACQRLNLEQGYDFDKQAD